MMWRDKGLLVPAIAAVLAVAGLALGDDGRPPQAEIDAAIRRGGEWLAKRGDAGRAEELVGLTLLHAGFTADDPAVAPRVARAAKGGYATTYRIALAAMLLEAADRVEHQARIATLAQALCDTQCENGQWSYGDKAHGEGDTNEPDGPSTTTTPDPGGGGAKAQPGGSSTQARRRVRLKWSGANGPDHGDNSNAQFALLGLRAAEDAGVEVPQETWALAKKWWAAEQKPDGGFAYHAVKKAGQHNDPSYGSMTCVGIASLAICDNYLKADFRAEKTVPRAVEWLGKSFTLEENPLDPPKKAELKTFHRHYYWIYSIERAGVLGKIEKLGAHAWYAEGARWLLAKQGEDGAWGGDPIDTCFAILFLKRATAPLRPRVSTPGGG
jgi:hypothetical protein